MKCPDSRHELREQIRHGVTVDQCQYCGGAWFDAGELEAIRRKSPRGARGSSEREIDLRPEEGLVRRHCPRCDAPTFQFGRLGGERVDRCSQCKGLWIPHKPTQGLSGAPRNSEIDESALWDILEVAYRLMLQVAFLSW